MILFWVFLLAAGAATAGLVCVVRSGARSQVFPVEVTQEQDTETEEVSS